MSRRSVVAWTATFLTALLAAGLPDPADAIPLERDPVVPRDIVDGTFQPPPNGFHWSVPSRFGRDDNGDGIIDYHWNDRTRQPEHGGPAETYDPAWVHPRSFAMHFDGCPTASEAARSDEGLPTENTYTWQIDGRAYPRRDCRLGPEPAGADPFTGFMGQGVYPVTLTITRPDGSIVATYTQETKVRDLLVVSLGDSYGSGEGNPDKYQVLDSDGGTVQRKAEWVDKRCHRSASAGAAQAARAIEASDPKTSITFLSFACSGATIDTAWGTSPIYPYEPPKPGEPNPGTGVLGPYSGTEPAVKDSLPPLHTGYEGRPYAWGEVGQVLESDAAPAWYPRHLPSQIDQLKLALQVPGAQPGTYRPVDALVVSGGGNDAGFAPVATQCVLALELDCMGSWVNDKHRPSGTIPLEDRFSQDVAGLSRSYDRLDAVIDSSGVPIARTYLTEYPGSTTNDAGEPCSAILEDVLHPNVFLAHFLWTRVVFLSPVLATLGFLWSQTRQMAGEEVVWADKMIAPGINTEMRAAAEKHQWRYVGGIGQRYVGHGYCSSDPYIRRAPESSRLQGPWSDLERIGIHVDTKGTLHPNVTGHRMYAEQLIPLLSDQFELGSGAAEFTLLEQVGGSQSRRGNAGWLTGRCPVGSTACTSDAVVVSVEARDVNVLRGAEASVNGRTECPPGAVCTAELVDPFTYRWTFTFASDGIWRLALAVRNQWGYVTTFNREVKVDLNDPSAVAVLESSTAPTRLRFDGVDGRGSGVDQILFDGLWHGAPGSTGAGETVVIGLGGAYGLTFWAVDEAGRTGPPQTELVTLDGPTMSGDPARPGSGTSAWASEDCARVPGEDFRLDNQRGTATNHWYDGRGVSFATERTSVSAFPAHRVLAASARARWGGRTTPEGWNEDFCVGRSEFRGAPLNVGTGTSGLRPGDPVTLRATLSFPGSLAETTSRSDDSGTSVWGHGFFTIRDSADPASPEAVSFLAKAERDIWAGPGYIDRSLHYQYEVSSNREQTQSENVWEHHSSRAGEFSLPVQTWSITFDTRVGARNVIDGRVVSFASAWGERGIRASSSADFTALLDIEPAPGFEGIELVHGDLDRAPAAPAAPTVVLTDPVNAANVGSAMVSGTGEAATTATISVDDGNPATPAVTATVPAGPDGYGATLNLSSIDDGTLTATVTLTDAAGNTGPAGTDTATKDIAAPAAPSVVLTDPVNAANVGSATVSGTGEAATTATISVDDDNPSTPAATATVPAGPGGYRATLDLSSLDDGTLTATVTLTDAAGNTGPAGTDTATKDIAAPAAPTVVLTDPVNAANVSSATVSGTGEAATTATVSVDDDNPATPAVTATVPAGPDGYRATLNLSSLDNGTLTATVTLTDAAGNTAPAGTDTARKVGRGQAGAPRGQP